MKRHIFQEEIIFFTTFNNRKLQIIFSFVYNYLKNKKKKIKLTLKKIIYKAHKKGLLNHLKKFKYNPDLDLNIMMNYNIK